MDLLKIPNRLLPQKGKRNQLYLQLIKFICMSQGKNNFIAVIVTNL